MMSGKKRTTGGKTETFARNSSPYCHLKEKVDPDHLERDVTPLLAEVRPMWGSRYQWRLLKGGTVNTTAIFWQEGDSDKSDAIVVRIYSDAVAHIVSREDEFMAMQIAHAAGCFPAIYASFGNGVMYRYAHGRIATYVDYVKPEVIRAIARAFSKLHHVDVSSLELWDRRGQPATFDMTLRTPIGLEKRLTSMPTHVKGANRDRLFQQYRAEVTDEVLRSEVDYMRSVMEQVQLPVGFSHGDCGITNILYDDQTGAVTLVDWELSACHYRSRDVAYFVFNHKVYMELQELTKPEDPDITPEVRDLWLRNYLEAMYEDKGLDPSTIRDSDLEMMSIEHEIMQIHGSLEFLLVAIAFTDLAVGCDFLARIPVAKDRYFSTKDQLPQLVERYLELKRSNGHIWGGESHNFIFSIYGNEWITSGICSLKI